MIKDLFIADLKTIRSWWSVRLSILWALLLAAIPPIADQFPSVAPSLLSLFPKHGQQWVPIAGAVLFVAARVVSQAALLDRLRGMFGKKDDGAH
jgi:hypothetical protein